MVIIDILLPFVRSYSSRQRLWVAVLFGLAVLLWGISYAAIASLEVIDDEGSYIPAAQAIAAFLAGKLPVTETVARVVRYGWFMPGVPVFMTPIFLIAGNPDMWLVRLYAGLLIMILWLWMQREVDRALGPNFVIALLAFPTLMLVWQFFAKTALGDLPAGLAMTIAFCRLSTMSRAILAGEELRLPDVVIFELVLLLMIYLRGSTSVLVAAVHIYLAVILLLSGNRPLLFASLGRLVLGAALFASLLAPWSLLVSKQMKAPVLTTTSTMLSLGMTFGDIRKLCFGPCAEGNAWFVAGDFAREKAAERGVSELAVQREMAQAAMSDLDYQKYFSAVRRNFRSFLFNPNGFNRLFVDSNMEKRRNINKNTKDAISHFLKSISAISFYVLYVPFLAFLFLGNVAVVWRRQTDQIQSLLMKMFSVCFLIQPFIHFSHPRYWVTFGPLMALSAAAIFTWAQAVIGERRGARPAGAFATAKTHVGDFVPGLTVLSVFQLLHVALMLVVAAVVFLG